MKNCNSESQKGRMFYVVLGIKWELVSDTETESEYSFIFESLENAVRVTKENAEEFGYGAIAEVRILEEYFTPPKDGNRG